MCPVRFRIDGGSHCDKVEAMYVIDISVAVIIGAGSTVCLGLVCPYVPGEVLMAIVHTPVNDCNCHVAVPENLICIPCFLQLHVDSCPHPFLISGIVIMPLVSIAGIIHCHRSRTYPECRFGDFNAGCFRHSGHCSCDRHVVIELNGEPFVQSGLSLSGFKPAAYPE